MLMSKKIKLTKIQKQKLLQIKQKNKSSIIRDRAHAVLLREQGLTLKNITQVLFRSKDFVNQAIKKFKNKELENMNFNGHNHKLSCKQKEAIIKMIKNETPKELKGYKFKEQFWSTDILKAVIKKKYKIEYKYEKSYYDLFKAAGFSFKSPKPRDFRQDPEKMKEFKGALKKSSTTTKIRMSW